MASRAGSSHGDPIDQRHKAKNTNQHGSYTINSSNRAFGMDRGSDHNSKPSTPSVLYTSANRADSRSYGRDLSSSPEPYRKNPPPRRHKRDASQTPSRSPSPYRRRRDDLRRQTPSRSPSPYRHKRNDVRRRSPSPYYRRRDDRPYDARDSSRSQYKRKASPPRGERSDKRRQGDNKRYSPDKQYRGSNNYGDRQRDYSQPPKFDDDRSAPRSNHNDRKSLKPISYADNEGPPAVPGFRQSLDLSAQRSQDRSNSSQAQVRNHQAAEIEQQSRPSTGQSSDMDMTSPPEEPEESVVEKAPPKETLEEKKRRWAAIRAANAAKEKENPKETLLHQAQIGNASENTTPMAASPAGFADSPVSPASPRPGQLDTAPASPDIMLVDKQQVVTDGSSPAADGPSAGDYDPTKDMLDDRDRAMQKSASAYSETDPKLLSTLPATKVAPVKEEKDFDMFASDDDEDENSNEPDNDTKGVVLHENLLDNWDDAEHYYKIIPRELVKEERYQIVKFLGRGVFANVVEAEDLHSRNKDARPQEGKTKLQSDGTRPSLVAIKIIRRNDLMRVASQKEMEFVRKVNEADPNDIRHIIRLLDSFDHKGHLCVVFEHMSKNLRDLLKYETNGRGLALPAVRTYARQMFIALKHLQDCQVVHCDLKPDNILVSPDHKTIKICDFGTAVDKRDIMERTEYLVSRFYRAPEIILGFEVGYGIDMWAIGCTLYELWTGKILFMGRSNNQMLKAFIDCLGWPSEKLLKKGDLRSVGEHFEQGPPLKFTSREVDDHGNISTRKIEQQKKIARDLRTRVHDGARNITQDRPTNTELNDFADLLGATLNFNVEKRVQPKEALSHKFFPTQPKLLPKAPVIKPPMIKRGGAKFRR